VDGRYEFYSLMQTEILNACCLCHSSRLSSFDAVVDLQRCDDCSFVFANPRPTLDELTTYYSKPSKYDGWLNALEERDRLWKRRLKKMQKTKKGGTLLDVGTGIGQF
jgi:hypothetical protein